MPDETTLKSVEVLVDNTELSKQAYADLASVSVDLDIDALAMFTLELANRGEEANQTSWSDVDLFKPGGSVSIKFGPIGSLTAVMAGEVTGMEFEDGSGEGQKLIVRGYDKSHRTLRSTKIKSYAEMSASDIAKDIASKNSLTPSVTATGVTHLYVLQDSESDFAFLRRLAKPFGFVVYVDDSTLYFGPRKYGESAKVTLTRGVEIESFHLSLSTQGLPGEVVVQGWSSDTKKALSGKASASDITKKMGTTLGLAKAESAFGKATVTYVDYPVAADADAQKIALAKLEEAALEFIQGEVTCAGSSALKPGIVVALDGLGTTFSGNYFVVSAKHSFVPDQGYKTTLSVRRNAL